MSAKYKSSPPSYKITANGKAATAAFNDRLLHISVVDNIDNKADSLTLKFDDRDGLLEIPETGSSLEIHLGYEANLVNMGSYIVSSNTLSGPPKTLSVRASTADMESSLLDQKSYLWEQTTLEKIVNKIASNNSYSGKVDSSLGAIEIKSEVQHNESDIHFITRLAKQYGAIAKPANGQLLLLPEGTATDASGRKLKEVAVSADDLIQWSLQLTERNNFSVVVARWHDRVKNILHTYPDPAPMGAGRVFTIKKIFSTAEEAKSSAEAKLRELNARGGKLSLTILGDPEVAAGGEINIAGFRGVVDGSWVVRQATHTLDKGGYRCELELFAAV